MVTQQQITNMGGKARAENPQAPCEPLLVTDTIKDLPALVL